MFAASTYEEIERIERQVENMEIVVFLFARPTEEKILKEFEYIHYNSARYCSIYVLLGIQMISQRQKTVLTGKLMQ